MPSKGILVALAEQLNLGVLGGRFEACCGCRPTTAP
ncbi:MAG: hypothetical protein QOE57_2711 [Acidimicrobiaceae bacterium]|nr:hypothetical protein [Acidimicrobiaceae bacterium]MDQ1377704.1 hypothetical protein [Acidimicrobiaceae bacterium]